ncbi:helix-turn-helix domain-containing protein [Corallococcus carmarthensis]|uniref:Transcriptional regulator n=1 Tax=Corallococcus carmarthensis TaxID=2316728 RepID=A0A3A8K1S7_9BACT|nr:helix-turn-helix domain-containing protein [Corallococcus carmarthensis]NOK17198.1 helix-turn-helix transcriptional regulator [Corallococcus carmarthensis]RKH01950.1 transcriptional regulator [Corallococcus carmarthensis]
MDQLKATWIRALAQTVKTQRIKLGLTQQDLSVLAGCGPVFIYDIESGRKATLRLDKLLDVLNVLGLQLAIEPLQQRLQASEQTS